MTPLNNLLAGIPASLPDEFIQTLAAGTDCHIERIVSRGHQSPDGFWYDQPRDEFVLLLQGAARIEFESAAVDLHPGDHLLIPARCRHRVAWTAPDSDTVWLAVHFSAAAAPTVLFLCTGNFYRSRFAEILFNHHAAERGLDWRAWSRGLALTSMNVGAMSPLTISRLQTLRIGTAGYDRLPQSATAADFAAARHVVAVKEAEHRPLIRQQFPDWQDRIEYWGVHDIDCAGPDEALPELETHVLRLLDRLAAG